MAESAHEMEIAMKRLFDTGEGADLTLICRDKTWKVHSSYLWPRSSWFKAACKAGFKESETQRVELPEEEPSMVYRMVQHLYMQTYTVNLGLEGLDRYWSFNDSWAATRLHVHAQMYSLGDKYDLPGLKREAARRFTEDVKIPGDCKSETLILLSVVPIVYTITPDSDRRLRNLLVRRIFERYDTASKHFVEELDRALEVRHFARDIIVLHSKRPAIDYATLAKQLHLIWHRYVRTPLAATTSSFPTPAALRARLLATGSTLGGIYILLCATLLFLHILDGHIEMIRAYVEQRPRLHRCWARPPIQIEDWMWRVWGLCKQII